MATMTISAGIPTGMPGTPAWAQPRLRLTRRGRLVVAVAGSLAALAGFVGILGLGSPQAEASVARQPVVHTVLPGETLWGIAGSVAGSGDVAAAVYEIRRLNGLEGSQLVPGQSLVLPS